MYLDEAARLHEGEGMERPVDERAELVAQRVLGVEGRLQLSEQLEVGRVELGRRDRRRELLLPRLERRERALLLEGVKRLLDEHLDVSGLDAHLVTASRSREGFTERSEGCEMRGCEVRGCEARA